MAVCYNVAIEIDIIKQILILAYELYSQSGWLKSDTVSGASAGDSHLFGRTAEVAAN